MSYETECLTALSGCILNDNEFPPEWDLGSCLTSSFQYSDLTSDYYELDSKLEVIRNTGVMCWPQLWLPFFFFESAYKAIWLHEGLSVSHSTSHAIFFIITTLKLHNS